MHVIQEMGTGGAERLVELLAERSLRRGHEVAVACRPGETSERMGLDTFPIPLISKRLTAVPSAARAVRRAADAWRPDILHVHNPGMALAAGLATRRGRVVPGIVTVHNYKPGHERGTRLSLRAAGLPVIACGPAVADALTAAGTRVHATVLNAVEAPSRRAGREELAAAGGVDPRRPLAVFVGRMVPQKDPLTAVRAVAATQMSLVMLGDGPLAAEVEAEVRRLGVGDRVRVAGRREDARSLMAGADLLLMTSRWEGLPLVALEAAAAGVPVVATRVQGVAELFEGTEAAVLAPAGDPGAVAAALEGVVGDERRAERMRRATAELARQHDPETMMQRYDEIYRRAAAMRGPRLRGPVWSGETSPAGEGGS